MSEPYETPLPSPKLRELVSRELEPDEHLLWGGQPIPKFFTGASFAIVLFVIPWTLISVFISCAALFDGRYSPLTVIFFGFPFVLIGLSMLSSPIMVYRNLENTVYAITNRRAIIIVRYFFSTNIVSFEPNQLKELQRHEKTNGIGDVLFSELDRAAQQSPTKVPMNGFLNVREAKKVERLLKNLAAQAVEIEEQESEDDDTPIFPSLEAFGPPPRDLPLSVRFYLRQYSTSEPVFGWFFAGFGFMFALLAACTIESAKINHEWSGTLVFLGVGSLFGIIGLCFPIYSWFTGGKMIRLLQNGLFLDENFDVLYDPIQPDQWFIRNELPKEIHFDELTGRFWVNPLRCVIPLLAATIVCGEIVAIIVIVTASILVR